MQCGACGVCNNGQCQDQVEKGPQGKALGLRCSRDGDCNGSKVCRLCGFANLQDFGFCVQPANRGRRRRSLLSSLLPGGGASHGFAARFSPRGPGGATAAAGAQPEPQAQQPDRLQQARRLSSREVNSLLHSQLATAQQEQQGGTTWGRHLQQAADAAPPALAVPPTPGPLAAPPPPPSQPILDARAADLSGSGSGLYVVTTTGLQLNASDAAAAILPDALASQVQSIVGQLQSALSIQRSGDLQQLWNTLFWVSLGLACVLALHAAIRGLLIWRRWRLPMFFEWPRPELWYLWCLLPILAAQGSKFLATGQGAGQVAAAVIFGLLVPLGLVAVSFWLVYKHLTMAAAPSAHYLPEADRKSVV